MNIRYFLFTVLLTCVSFFTITYTSCIKDECKDVVCRNGGACNGGTCNCPSGYSGLLCETAPPVDPCAGIVCQNAGTCNNGACSCPANYEGEFCQNAVSAKFAGTYNTLETCTMNGSSSYTVSIAADGLDPTLVSISNLGNYSSCGTIVLSGTISGSQLTIDDTECGYHFTASGTLNGTAMSLTYSVTFNNITETCTATMNKTQ